MPLSMMAAERLQAPAVAADVFVMVSASAKHSATIAIQQWRPKEKALLMPKGKGSISILEELRRWVRNREMAGSYA